ncbi:conserved protein, unknown function [Hepatocystis sp. ex Piliocolobus tephrosceles]|nr:conserved protein, unknown function [Hepatocystis sp. ex Piliocolobus tephrosceles]
MNEVGFLSHPPPKPDFWIYFAKYLRLPWVQWAIVLVPFILFAIYLKFTMPSYAKQEKEASEKSNVDNKAKENKLTKKISKKESNQASNI